MHNHPSNLDGPTHLIRISPTTEQSEQSPCLDETTPSHDSNISNLDREARSTEIMFSSAASCFWRRKRKENSREGVDQINRSADIGRYLEGNEGSLEGGRLITAYEAIRTPPMPMRAPPPPPTGNAPEMGMVIMQPVPSSQPREQENKEQQNEIFGTGSREEEEERERGEITGSISEGPARIPTLILISPIEEGGVEKEVNFWEGDASRSGSPIADEESSTVLDDVSDSVPASPASVSSEEHYRVFSLSPSSHITSPPTSPLEASSDSTQEGELNQVTTADKTEREDGEEAHLNTMIPSQNSGEGLLENENGKGIENKGQDVKDVGDEEEDEDDDNDDWDWAKGEEPVICEAREVRIVRLPNWKESVIQVEGGRGRRMGDER